MSPFKSKSQFAKFKALEHEGKLPTGTADKWLSETPKFSELPNVVKGTKAKTILRKAKKAKVV